MEQTASKRTVRVIPPTRARGSPAVEGRKRLKRVAAYCRVSTDTEEQLNSYEAQKAYYTQLIQDNPEWELAGVFADEGISATSTKKRTEFNRMIAACKRGRIDMILTKSLSRFSRNTLDCLDIVRTLKAQGIGVIFEKENINTLTQTSEFMMTLFSGFAQAESESISRFKRAWNPAMFPSITSGYWATARERTDSRRLTRREPKRYAVSTGGIWREPA